MEESDEELQPFAIDELGAAMKHLKPGNAAGLDGITVEGILHFGANTKRWVLALFNNCARKRKIPNLWRRAKVVALLKAGKDPKISKSYQPISLLCFMSE